MPSLLLAQIRYAKYFKGLLSKLDDIYLEGGSEALDILRKFDTEYTHIFLTQTWAAQNQDRIQEALEISNALPNVGANILELRLSADQRITWRKVALKSARSLKNLRTEGAHLNALGNAYRELGQLSLAQEYYEQRINMNFEGGEIGRALALNNLGLVLADQGQIREAEALYAQVLGIGKEKNNLRLQTLALGNLANVHMDLDQVSNAIKEYEQALTLDRDPALDDPRSESIDLGNLGYAYSAAGNHDKGLECINKSLEIARRLNDRLGEGTSLGHLGRVYFSQGKMELAIDAYNQQLTMAHETGHKKEEAEALGNLGEVYQSQGRLDQAIHKYLHALEIDTKMGNKQNQAIHSWNLGWVYVEKGDIGNALHLLQVFLDYESGILHPNAQLHMDIVEKLRSKSWS